MVSMICRFLSEFSWVCERDVSGSFGVEMSGSHRHAYTCRASPISGGGSMQVDEMATIMQRNRSMSRSAMSSVHQSLGTER